MADTGNRVIEKIMLESLLEAAAHFYNDPKNKQAFEAWQNERSKHGNSRNQNHV